MFSKLVKKLDTASIIEASGVGLRRQGNRFVGLCPFHEEKTPSFFVFDDQRFKCFGCGEYGDVIDFVQKFYSLSFQEALNHLGIEQSRMTPEMKRHIEQQKRKIELIKDFRKWQSRYLAHLGTLINRTLKLMEAIAPEDFELYALLLHGLPEWEYHSDILLNGIDNAKNELYKEARKWKILI